MLYKLVLTSEPIDEINSDQCSNRAGCQSSVVKPKPKLVLWPITTDTDNQMDQSELKANTCLQRVTIGFSFTCDWLTNWREIF